MLIDGLNLAEGSVLTNATIASGTEFPQASIGELFFRSDLAMLHVFNGTEWLGIGSSAAMLEDHPGSYYLDLGNATGVLSVDNGGTGVSTLALLKDELGLQNLQPLDGDLTAIAGIQTNSGLLRKTAANTWVLDTSAYLTGNQTITVTGDVAGSGATAISTTLASVGTPGTYKSVTTDAKGRVTAGTNPTTLAGYGITDAQPLDGDLTAIAGLAGATGLARKTAANSWILDTSAYLTGNQNISVTGDVTGAGTTALPLTLASVGTPGTYKIVTTDAKGRVTGGSSPTTLDGFGITDALRNTDSTFTGTLTMVGDIVPSTNVTYNLGSPTKMWKDIYVGPGSIYMNGKKILEEVASTIVFSSDDNQNVRIETSGTGNLELQTAPGGAVLMKGTLSISSGKRIVDSAGIQVEFADDIAMSGNKITGLSAPVVGTDAANKAYVDSATLSDATLVRTTGTQTISGDKTFTGNTTIAGNLTISGTTTTVNSQTVLLADNILELNSDFTAGTPSENAGIQIRRGDLGIAQFLWDEANDRFTMVTGAGASLPLYTGDTITAGSFVGPLTGNASTATTLATPRTINGASFNGSANISFTTDAVAEGSSNLYFTNARASAAAPVQSFNGRTGPIALSTADVTGALGFAPANKAGDTFTGTVTAPTFVGSLAGNATTATTLATARTINGVSFNGSANISYTTSNVAEGTNLYFTSARASAAAPVQSVFGRTGAVSLAGADVTTALGFAPANKAGDTFTGTVTAPTFVGSLAGNASSATKLATARTINGSSFDGTANISFNSDSVAEGSSNLYFSNVRAANAAPVQSVNGRTGAITIGSGDVTGALGFTPIQQGGGVGQEANKIYIGWSSSFLKLQVDSTNFGNTWPIGITGNAATATNATNATYATTAGSATDATKLPLAGGTMTGTLTTLGLMTRSPAMVTSISSINNAYAPGVDVPITNITTTNSLAYVAALRQKTMLSNDGYVQHIGFGAYRFGNGTGWGGGAFIGVGESDSSMTAAYHFERNGILTYSGDGRTFLSSANYNNYSPTLTGGNASGTWPISITGNAVYATNATRLYASDSSYVYGGSAPYYLAMTYDGTRWRLNANPGTPAAVGVAYADVAGNASNAGGLAVTAAGTPNTVVARDGAGNIVASGVGGFTSATYVVNARNPIWRFGNSDAYGISYFQGTTGWGGGGLDDTIGLHFGTATSAGSPFQFHYTGKARFGSGLDLMNSGNLNLYANGAEDIGDIVWMSSAGVEKHRLYDGSPFTGTLGYRANGGATYGIIHSGNIGTYIPTTNAGAVASTTPVRDSAAGLNAATYNSYVGDSGYVIYSLNTTASSSAQFYVKHNLGNVEIGNSRGALTLYGNATSANTATTATTATSATSASYASLTAPYGTPSNANTQFTDTPTSRTSWIECNGSANAPNAGWWFLESIRHSNGSNYWGAQYAHGWEDNANKEYRRNVSGGTWSAWVEMIGSNTIYNYAPSLTGSGASGTWGINITGNAGTATYADEARNNYFYVRGVSPTIQMVDTDQGQSRYMHHNGGSIGFLNSAGNWVLRCDDSTIYGTFNGSGAGLTGTAGSLTAGGLSNHIDADRISADVNTMLTNGTYGFAGQPANAPTTYGAMMVARNADVGLQIAGGYNSDNLYFRGWYSYGGGFTPWRTLIHNANIGSQAVASAAALTGPARTNGSDGWFRSTGATGWYNESYAVGIYCDTGGAVKTYNSARIISNNGSQSLPAFSFSQDQDTGLFSPADGYLGFCVNAQYAGYMVGNSLNMYGDVTAFSDERLKKNWVELDDDFVERWATVKHGIYDRIDYEMTQVGLSAQSVQEILPNAVQTDKDGMLSLNYGGAAAVASVQLAKKVVNLEAKVARLEALVSKLIGE